jgi:phosphatidylglycerol:prolipoprotein diacylglycerol transferase
MSYDTTTANIFGIPPYFFFYVIGVAFASSLFILLLLKYKYNIPRYTKIYFLSGAGLLIGAKLFGIFTGLINALVNNNTITINTFLNTGIVFYGGLFGFIAAFIIICKIWNKKLDYRVIDIAVVTIPLFHFWGRLGCFFAGCCYGIETQSKFSILYTTYSHIEEKSITVSRFPVQLIEASINLAIFFILIILLFKERQKGHLLLVYFFIYALIRIILEFFRGDLIRGVWNSISFGQTISIIILICCSIFLIKLRKGKKHEIN